MTRPLMIDSFASGGGARSTGGRYDDGEEESPNRSDHEWFRCYRGDGSGNSWDLEFPRGWSPSVHAGVHDSTGLPLCSSRDMAANYLGPSSPIASIVAERDAALAELDRGLDREMKVLRLANGGIDMAVAGPIVERWGVAMTGWLRQGSAENYIEMGLNARTEPFDRYCVTVQKYGALSPHQLRQAAEDRASTADAEGDVARELAGLT